MATLNCGKLSVEKYPIRVLIIATIVVCCRLQLLPTQATDNGSKLATTTQATPTSALDNSPQNDRLISKQNENAPTKFAAAEKNPKLAKNCDQPCSSVEFTIILQMFIQNENSQVSGTNKNNNNNTNGAPNGPPIRQKCVKQLIEMIKNLASGELEMKTLLEFASNGLPLNRRLDLTSLKSSYATNRAQAASKSSGSSVVGDTVNVSDGPPCSASGAAGGEANLNGTASGGGRPLGASVSWFGDDQLNQFSDDKSRFLNDLVTNVDQWLEALERFTVTREWSSLMKIFRGLESILKMFVDSKGKLGAKSHSKITSHQSPTTASANSSKELELLDEMKSQLPEQVQTLAQALNQLLPWHVWPWNNVDLFATIDTFLNHGIFAFSKTTSGPERRIDYLSQMLETLFNSLKYDSFPKKCADWSRVICDLDSFHDRLALAPTPVSPSDDNSTTTTTIAHEQQQQQQSRRFEVAKLASINKNKLIQELTCIMFSSLSLQQFGQDAHELAHSQQARPATSSLRLLRIANSKAPKAVHNGLASISASTNGAGGQLDWDKQVKKALRLYGLSREALNDEQWFALYQQVNDFWNRMKVSDRVIMIGRIVQLITNCHMPREILESALWKDIYKYKNALNQIGDIVIEELNRSSENGKFTIEQLALGSKSLDEILSKFLNLLPRLIESISRTLVDQLPELVAKFFNEKAAFFKAPCKGYSFGQLVPSLAPHQSDILQLERLICRQLDIKPSITMMQINNLTNEFLAMAFNFSSFGNPLQNLPRFRTTGAGLTPTDLLTKTSSHLVTGERSTRRLFRRSAGERVATSSIQAAKDSSGGSSSSDNNNNSNNNGQQTNASSIVDELVANPRLAQIVAILQSSALDPPEIHAELPELDWVEAGTSVALFYESIQRLLSHEGGFVIFPELKDFQEHIQISLESSQQLFKRFAKRDPIHLVAYSFDGLMPILLRTYQPLGSFHSECLSTFNDIFGRMDAPDAYQAKELRQWQCAISSVNFALHSLNNIIRTFNSMLRNILGQMSRQHENLFKPPTGGSRLQANSWPLQATFKQLNSSEGATCVLFDGSVTTLMDNLPQLIDIALETVLIASTNSNQQQPVTLKDTLCSTNNTLDPFIASGKQQQLKAAICHLLHESSLATCSEALKFDEWTKTMRQLNATWFEASPISIEPSFRGILQGAHDFLDLFGKVKPSSMSDGLIARVLNLNSYWTSLVNKVVSSVEKYREKRFELALQVLIPIIYDNFATGNGANGTQSKGLSRESRSNLRTSILAAKATLDYLANGNGGPSVSSANSGQLQLVTNQIEQQLATLFAWADKYSTTMAEVLLKTVAKNVTKLELLLKQDIVTGETKHNHSADINYYIRFDQLWARFCYHPVDTYLDLESNSLDSATGSQIGLGNRANLAIQGKLVVISEAKGSICGFEWAKFQRQLLALDESGSNNNQLLLDHFNDEQLTRILLTKWGQVLDYILASGSSTPVATSGPSIGSTNTIAEVPTSSSGESSQGNPRMPKFLSFSHWQTLQEKLPQLAPQQFGPSDFGWIWQAVERLVLVSDSQQMQSQQSNKRNQTLDMLMRIFDQLNCALDSVKGGLTWDNLANIYQDRQDILAAHSTINNGIALASAGANTFLAHKKFQKFLDDFVKPRAGMNPFCDMRDKSKLEKIFSRPNNVHVSDNGDGSELATALESFQELVCDANIDSIVQNLNPISVCYQSSTNVPSNATNLQQQQPQRSPSGSLASMIDRFFKLASLAVLDAKLVDTSDTKPPIFEKSQWDQLRNWWLNQTESHQGNSGLALTLVRLLQTTDSINSDHVVWKAFFRSVHELSEVAAYLIRAAELEHHSIKQTNATSSQQQQPTAINGLSRLALVAEQVDGALRGHQGFKASNLFHQQQQLASTLTNVLFPEANNFISFKTFKQLRYIKSITEYFVTTPDAKDSICVDYIGPAQQQHKPISGSQDSKFELIGYKLDSADKLNSLLCHYQPAQWLTTLNIVLSSRTASLSKKVSYMTKYLSIFVKSFKDNESLQSFIHGQQLENIEAVANTTVSYLIALSHPFKTISLGNISNISWHSIPGLLDSINTHLCASKHEQQQGSSNMGNANYQLAVYEPKRFELETIICKLPTWNITQIYNYLSENFDLKNVISLVAQNNRTATLFGISATATTLPTNTTSPIKKLSSPKPLITNLIQANQQLAGQQHTKACITPFKFASKWLKIVQDLIDETMSKTSRDKLKKCFGSSRKSQSISSQAHRYVKLINNLLTTINDLTVNNSWHLVRKTWGSVSFALLNQS